MSVGKVAKINQSPIAIRNGRWSFLEIPKDNGKMRLLGIPTVVDRLVQQAINQVLTPIYENQFSKTSYGFRPRRGCHDALRGAQRIINEGYIYVVDLDLERFFDTVSHSKLIEILSRTIKDGRVVSLIHKYLRSGVMNKGLFEASEEGTPQVGPLSPLLSNIMLNELDKELERRGLPFVRYADDSMIFCKSKRAAMRVKKSISSDTIPIGILCFHILLYAPIRSDIDSFCEKHDSL